MASSIIERERGFNPFQLQTLHNNTLVVAITAAGLVDTLCSPGPFTVFARTDAAFAKLPTCTVEALLKDTKTLSNILTYHVVAGNFMADDVVKLTSAKTVEGENVHITIKDGKVYINDAQVVITDIATSNGVILVIDTVLLPPASNTIAVSTSSVTPRAETTRAQAPGIFEIPGAFPSTRGYNVMSWNQPQKRKSCASRCAPCAMPYQPHDAPNGVNRSRNT